MLKVTFVVLVLAALGLSPAGAFQLDSSKFYTASQAVYFHGTDQGVAIYAYCNVGDFAVHGGCFSGGLDDALIQSGQSDSTTPTVRQGWMCQYDHGAYIHEDLGDDVNPHIVVVTCAHE